MSTIPLSLERGPTTDSNSPGQRPRPQGGVLTALRSGLRRQLGSDPQQQLLEEPREPHGDSNTSHSSRSRCFDAAGEPCFARPVIRRNMSRRS
jgi:hypothetical protein